MVVRCLFIWSLHTNSDRQKSVEERYSASRPKIIAFYFSYKKSIDFFPCKPSLTPCTSQANQMLGVHQLVVDQNSIDSIIIVCGQNMLYTETTFWN